MRPLFVVDDLRNIGRTYPVLQFEFLKSPPGAVQSAHLEDVFFCKDGAPMFTTPGDLTWAFVTFLGSRLCNCVALDRAEALSAIEASAVALGEVGMLFGAGNPGVWTGALTAQHCY